MNISCRTLKNVALVAGSMCTSNSSTALNGDTVLPWRASRNAVTAVLLSPPLCR